MNCIVKSLILMVSIFLATDAIYGQEKSGQEKNTTPPTSTEKKAVQTKSDAPSQRLKSYFSPTTIGVIEFDIQNPDLEKLFDRLEKTTDDTHSKSVYVQLKQTVADFRKARIRWATVVLTIDPKVKLQKRMILFASEEVDKKSLMPVVQKHQNLMPRITIHTAGQNGKGNTKETSPQHLKRIDVALMKNAKSPVRAAFALNPNVAQALAEMSPRRYGGTPEQSVTQLEWIAASMDPNNERGLVKAIIQLKTEKGVTALGKKVSALVDSVEMPANQKKYLSGFVGGLSATRITYQGKTVELQLLAGKENANDSFVSQFLLRSIEATLHSIVAKNIRDVSLAIHTYHDANQRMPSFAHLGKDKKPLLSWRVMVLPYLNNGYELYKQFKLDEPWDSEHNKKLIAKIPTAFRSRQPGVELGKTTILAPRNAKVKTAFDTEKITLPGIANLDGASNTIMLVNAASASATTWTKPDDFNFDASNPMSGLLEKNATGFHVALADVTILFLPNKLKPEQLLALFGRDDGEVSTVSDQQASTKSELPEFWFFEFLRN